MFQKYVSEKDTRVLGFVSSTALMTERVQYADSSGDSDLTELLNNFKDNKKNVRFM